MGNSLGSGSTANMTRAKFKEVSSCQRGVMKQEEMHLLMKVWFREAVVATLTSQASYPLSSSLLVFLPWLAQC